MKRTFADRPKWRRVTEKGFKLTNIREKDFDGYLSAIIIKKVSEPLIQQVGQTVIRLADEGYIWTQHFPSDRNYAMTTMFDEKHGIKQWYFDICDGNRVDPLGMPYYDDMYLDVVLLPTGEVLLLDEDELEEALKSGDVTREQYESAYIEARRIMEEIKNDSMLLPKKSREHLEYILERLEDGN